MTDRIQLVNPKQVIVSRLGVVAPSFVMQPILRGKSPRFSGVGAFENQLRVISERLRIEERAVPT